MDTQTRYLKPGDLPPLRASLYEADSGDQQRADWNRWLWSCQDNLLRQRDRQVEENLRMLHGQHWIVWSRLRGRYVNLADLLTDDERVWRHMPVLNRLVLWFNLLHTRMTENSPIITFQPGPDRIDAELAEVYEIVFKYLWRNLNMLETLDRLVAWLIPGGRSYLKSRINLSGGDPIPARMPATLQLLDQFGQPVAGADGQPISREVPQMPFSMGQDGNFMPAMHLQQDGETGDYAAQPIPGMQMAQMHEGALAVDVLSCLEVRGEWGPTPWHEKAYHIQKSLLTPMQAYEAFGVELEPDTNADEAESSGVFWRVLFGSGHFGSATKGGARYTDIPSQQQFVTIYESWHRPSRFPGTERTESSPGGRLLITTGGGKVIRDGVRPGDFRYGSPIRAFDFVKLPGRPQGTSPQEFMNGPIRTRNRLFAQKLAHATLAANPIRVLDRSQGLEEGKVPNTPGAEIVADRSRSEKPPVEYIGVPALGQDVDQAAMQLRDEIDELGRITGTEGQTPTGRASARLVQQLRMNSDRPVAGTMRSMVMELGRLAEDWLVYIPTIWDEEKLLSVAGSDGVARTIAVKPMLFRDGTINAAPDIESMLPETRQERMERAMMFRTSGVWGDPMSPTAIQQFLDYARFPQMTNGYRPGGPDRSMAETNLGRLLQGVPASQINVYPWYNFGLHRFVLEQFLKSPEYEKQSRQIKAELSAFWVKLRQAEGDQMLMERMRMQEIEGVAAGNALNEQGRVAANAPPQLAAGPQGDQPPTMTSRPEAPDATEAA